MNALIFMGLMFLLGLIFWAAMKLAEYLCDNYPRVSTDIYMILGLVAFLIWTAVVIFLFDDLKIVG